MDLNLDGPYFTSVPSADGDDTPQASETSYHRAPSSAARRAQASYGEESQQTPIRADQSDDDDLQMLDALPQARSAPVGRPSSRRKKKAGIPNAQWTREMEEALVQELLGCVKAGLRPNGTFKPEAYDAALSAVLEAAIPKKAKASITRDRVSAKVQNWRNSWKCWTYMTSGLSGWGLSEEGLPYNDPEVEEEYCANHPHAKALLKRPLPFAVEMDQLFGDVTVTGRYVQSGQHPHHQDDSQTAVDPALESSRARDAGSLDGDSENDPDKTACVNTAKRL